LGYISAAESIRVSSITFT